MKAKHIVKYVSIGQSISENGTVFHTLNSGAGAGDQLREAYDFLAPKYSKFFKMDDLSKLAYLTSELLFKGIELNESERENTGIFLCNSASSLDTDLNYQASIQSRENYVPSPSVFVYTLPNIMMGEIAIRHKFKGENYCLIFDKFDAGFMHDYSNILFDQYEMRHLLIGWVDLLKDQYYSFLAYVSNERNGKWEFTSKNLIKAYNNELI